MEWLCETIPTESRIVLLEIRLYRCPLIWSTVCDDHQDYTDECEQGLENEADNAEAHVEQCPHLV